MSPENNVLDDDLEFDAMRSVYSALKNLDTEAQQRVLDYVFKRLSISSPSNRPEPRADQEGLSIDREEMQSVRDAPPPLTPEEEGDEIEGISPIAQRWMRRSGLTAHQLSSLFSLGVEEIDLVATSVPGDSKRERVRSVILLLGIASYLSSGVARIADERVREVCGHYDAYDSPNFSRTVKALSTEVSGSKEAGYTLTARGITSATEMIKGLTADS